MEESKYNQEEVLINIGIFSKKEDDLKNQRKELNKELNRIKKQKEYWQNLDISQLKII